MAAVAYPCEGGCGFFTEDPFSDLTERGHLQKRKYCTTCLERVDAFMEAQDRLHLELAQRWQQERAVLVVEYLFAHGNLPDVG